MVYASRPLRGIVENVEVDSKLGCAKVYEDEYAAEEAQKDLYPNGRLICCDGFFNAVWIEYPGQ